jgi:hypothetical protein
MAYWRNTKTLALATLKTDFDITLCEILHNNCITTWWTYVSLQLLQMKKCEFIFQNQNKGSGESNGWKLTPTDCITIQNSPSATNVYLIIDTELREVLRENSRTKFCLKQLNRGRYCRQIWFDNGEVTHWTAVEVDCVTTANLISQY